MQIHIILQKIVSFFAIESFSQENMYLWRLYIEWMNKYIIIDWLISIWASEFDKVAGNKQTKNQMNGLSRQQQSLGAEFTVLGFYQFRRPFGGIHVEGGLDKVPKMPEKQTGKQP